MDPKEVRQNSVDWINLAENRDKREYGKMTRFLKMTRLSGQRNY